MSLLPFLLVSLLRKPVATALADLMSVALDGISPRLGVVAVDALWQGFLVAAGLALCLRILPRTSAALRFSVWISGFLLLVTVPFLHCLSRPTVSLPVGSPSGLSHPATVPIQPWLHLDFRWSVLITAVWAAASLLRAVDLTAHTLRLRRLWRSATPIISSSLSGVLQPPAQPGPAGWDVLSHLRILTNPAVEVCVTSDLDCPSVIGFLAPRILIPDSLLTQLTPDELRQIVLHEAEHLRRRDDWTNLLQKLSLVVFPLNPAMLWIEHELCREREMACDEGVIRATQAPRAYALCLTRLAEHGIERRSLALSLGAWHRRPELVRRVNSILTRRISLGPAASASLVAAVLLAMTAGAFELARSPQLVAFVSPAPVASKTVLEAYTSPQSAPQPAEARGDLPAHARRHLISPTNPSAVSSSGSEGQIVPVQLATDVSSSDIGRASRSFDGSVRAFAARAVMPDPSVSSSAELSRLSATPKPVPASTRSARRMLPMQSDYDDSRGAALREDKVGKSDMSAETSTSDPRQIGWIVVTTVFAEPSGPSQAQPAQGEAIEKSFTRTTTSLVLRVAPAGAESPNSMNHRYTAVPCRNGWIVFEL